MPMDVRRVIGKNVRKYRLAADLSQDAVAVRMGVDRAYISALELGRRNPTAVTLWHTAQALGVKVIDLLEESVDMPPTAPSEKRRASKKPAL